MIRSKKCLWQSIQSWHLHVLVIMFAFLMVTSPESLNSHEWEERYIFKETLIFAIKFLEVWVGGLSVSLQRLNSS